MGIKQLINVPSRMRDGVNLSCDIRMPAGPGPFPAILERTAYDNNLAATPKSEADLKQLLDGGYATVRQDCRGRYDSEGSFRPCVEDADGFDTVQWVAKQPWCNGKVGMFGHSYTAFTQLAAASRRPPALCAITPAAIGYDNLRGLMLKNGVLEVSSFHWSVGNDGRGEKPLPLVDWPAVYRTRPLANLGAAVGVASPILANWFAHPTRDRYWQAQNLEARLSKLDLPVLLAGGWYDKFALPIAELYVLLRRRAKCRNLRLIVGPWTHDFNMEQSKVGEIDFGRTAGFDLGAEKLRWLDRFVKGERNGVDTEAPVRLFVMGINRWRNESNWPLAGTTETSYHLGCRRAANSLKGDGCLTPAPATSGRDRDSYRYDPRDPTPSLGGLTYAFTGTIGPCDQRPAEKRRDVLCYTGPVLARPVEVTGFVKAELFVSTDVPDTDLIARLCDVYPDGRSITLCDGILRLRYRNGLDRQVLMQPGRLYRVEIAMDVTSNVFKRGHRIRLEVTSSCAPRFFPNLNTGGDNATETEPRTAEITVHHSAACPSRLILPVIEGREA